MILLSLVFFSEPIESRYAVDEIQRVEVENSLYQLSFQVLPWEDFGDTFQGSFDMITNLNIFGAERKVFAGLLFYRNSAELYDELGLPEGQAYLDSVLVKVGFYRKVPRVLLKPSLEIGYSVLGFSQGLEASASAYRISLNLFCLSDDVMEKPVPMRSYAYVNGMGVEFGAFEEFPLEMALGVEFLDLTSLSLRVPLDLGLSLHSGGVYPFAGFSVASSGISLGSGLSASFSTGGTTDRAGMFFANFGLDFPVSGGRGGLKYRIYYSVSFSQILHRVDFYYEL